MQFAIYEHAEVLYIVRWEPRGHVAVYLKDKTWRPHIHELPAVVDDAKVQADVAEILTSMLGTVVRPHEIALAE